MIEISLDERNVKLADEMLSIASKQVRAASNAAINRTLIFARKALSDQAAEKYTAKKGPIKKSMRVLRAGGGDMRGMVKSTGKSLPLTAFQVRFYRRSPVGVRVLKNSSLKPVKGLFLIGEKRDGHPALRTTAARYPLASVAGPSAPQMIGNNGGVEKVTDPISEYLNQRFTHEILFRFKGFGG